jgi:uncharacterized membrane protein YfcA
MTEICVFLAWIAGGFVSGVSGIGGAMVAFPFLAMLLPVHEAIALTCIVNMVMDICLASLHFRFCRVSALWPMLLASVPGSFAGLYILQICSGPVLQGAVGLLLLYYVYWQKTFRARGTIAHPRALGAVAGFGSGLLGTAIAFDGPPVGAYGLCMGWEPRVLLGTLGVFFVLRATVTLVLQGMAGFYTPTVLTCAMYGAPGVILGTCIAFPRGQAHLPAGLPQGAALRHRRGGPGLPGAGAGLGAPARTHGRFPSFGACCPASRAGQARRCGKGPGLAQPQASCTPHCGPPSKRLSCEKMRRASFPHSSSEAAS